jgi:hypothetical protein
MCTEFWNRNLLEVHLEDQKGDGSKILKWILGISVGMVWSGLNWLKTVQGWTLVLAILNFWYYYYRVSSALSKWHVLYSVIRNLTILRALGNCIIHKLLARCFSAPTCWVHLSACQNSDFLIGSLSSYTNTSSWEIFLYAPTPISVCAKSIMQCFACLFCCTRSFP